MAWTRFMDMHSGGRAKEKQEYIYIEAPKDEAIVIFYNRFGHSPYRVTCTCCGEDYVVYEHETLEDASAYDRGCKWVHRKGNRFGPNADGRYLEHGEPMPDGFVTDALSGHNKPQTIEEYQEDKNVLIIPASKIKDSERVGEVPEQGYVWVD